MIIFHGPEIPFSGILNPDSENEPSLSVGISILLISSPLGSVNFAVNSEFGFVSPISKMESPC